MAGARCGGGPDCCGPVCGGHAPGASGGAAVVVRGGGWRAGGCGGRTRAARGAVACGEGGGGSGGGAAASKRGARARRRPRLSNAVPCTAARLGSGGGSPCLSQRGAALRAGARAARCLHLLVRLHGRAPPTSLHRERPRTDCGRRVFARSDARGAPRLARAESLAARPARAAHVCSDRGDRAARPHSGEERTVAAARARRAGARGSERARLHPLAGAVARLACTRTASQRSV